MCGVPKVARHADQARRSVHCSQPLSTTAHTREGPCLAWSLHGPTSRTSCSLPPVQNKVSMSMPMIAAQTLQRQILVGAYAGGEMLPGQRALAESLGISRNSLREAIS